MPCQPVKRKLPDRGASVTKSGVRLCLIGSRGRMGQAIATLARNDSDCLISAEVDANDSLTEGLRSCDVAIDFSAPEAAEQICRIAVEYRRPLVIGTTGHTDWQRTCIEQAARVLPIVFASNFSAGVNILFWLTEQATRLLGQEFRPEIVETHHVMKKDAPSGTAKTLGQIIQQQRGRGEIPVQSIREGQVVGEHVVRFSGPGERLELRHNAESRETFASGALTAAKWVIGRPAGLYTMRDVLGL